jgi:type I restriction enzyme R subunit
VVIADEAHRSQYGFDAMLDKDGKFKYGYAQHLRDALPNATFIGFTGTPIESEDKDTRAVFGYDADYITFYVGDIDEDEIAIPFIHYVNIEDFAVKATLIGYRNGKATYNLLVK